MNELNRKFNNAHHIIKGKKKRERRERDYTRRNVKKK
jgi:hypothetical protein